MRTSKVFGMVLACLVFAAAAGAWSQADAQASLPPPINFQGQALSTTEIEWTWISPVMVYPYLVEGFIIYDADSNRLVGSVIGAGASSFVERGLSENTQYRRYGIATYRDITVPASLSWYSGPSNMAAKYTAVNFPAYTVSLLYPNGATSGTPVGFRVTAQPPPNQDAGLSGMRVTITAVEATPPAAAVSMQSQEVTAQVGGTVVINTLHEYTVDYTEVQVPGVYSFEVALLNGDGKEGKPGSPYTISLVAADCLPMITATSGESICAYEGSVKMDAAQQEKIRKACSDLKVQFDQTNTASTEGIRNEGRYSYGFPPGVVIGLSGDGIAHVMSKAFAQQISLPLIGTDIATFDAQENPLVLTVGSAVEIKAFCETPQSPSHTTMGGMAVVIAAFGTSKMMDPFTDEGYILGLWKLLENLPLPPVAEQARDVIMKLLNFSADAESSAATAIKTRVVGLEAEARNLNRGRLIRLEDTSLLEKSIHEDPFLVQAKSRAFNEHGETTIATSAEGAAKATGIARTTSESSTLYATFAWVTCRKDDGSYKIAVREKASYLGLNADAVGKWSEKDKGLPSVFSRFQALVEQDKPVDPGDVEAAIRYVVETSLDEYERSNKKDDKAVKTLKDVKKSNDKKK